MSIFPGKQTIIIAMGWVFCLLLVSCSPAEKSPEAQVRALLSVVKRRQKKKKRERCGK